MAGAEIRIIGVAEDDIFRAHGNAVFGNDVDLVGLAARVHVIVIAGKQDVAGVEDMDLITKRDRAAGIDAGPVFGNVLIENDPGVKKACHVIGALEMPPALPPFANRALRRELEIHMILALVITKAVGIVDPALLCFQMDLLSPVC